MKTENIIVGKDIFPNTSPKEIQNAVKKLKRFGIQDIEFLFEDGIKITYESDYVVPRNVPQLITFYLVKNNIPILNFCNNINTLDIYNEFNEDSDPIITFNIA